MPDRSNPFGVASHVYASARPQYPTELFAWIASRCSRLDDAWDCATGSGQAAVGLARYFRQVHATDTSVEQLEQAIARDNVAYGVSAAESTPFADQSFDVVGVAQALHWFDFARFWPEVSRLARPCAFFCAWGYDWFEGATDLDAQLVQPFRALIEPFWAPNNGILWRGYQDDEIRFPYVRERTPAFVIEVAWTLSQVVDFLTTWSAYKRSRDDPRVAAATDALLDRARDLSPATETIAIRMPLRIVAGKIR